MNNKNMDTRWNKQVSFDMYMYMLIFSELEIRGGIEDNSKIIFLIS